MKIIFLKNITVDVIQYDDVYDKCFRNNQILNDVSAIIPFSKNFSNVILSTGETLIEVKNDSFKEVTTWDQDNITKSPTGCWMSQIRL